MSSNAVELKVIHHLDDSFIAVGEHDETRPMIASGFEISDGAETFSFVAERQTGP